MLRKIVVPLDGSEFANCALPVAKSMAELGHVPMRIVGVARAGDELDWLVEHVQTAAQSVRNGAAATVEIVIDPEPAAALLHIADEAGALLCFASHDRPRFAAKLRHSVGSEFMARATRPYVVVGRGAGPNPRARDVAVAVDGVTNPEALLAAAVRWAARLGTGLRIVTVYEPVPADLRCPTHYTRLHGPAGDPEKYLEGLRDDIARFGVTNVSTNAIPDPISVAAGLQSHLVAHPARLVVVGDSERHDHPVGGTIRHLLSATSAPLLVVRPPA